MYGVRDAACPISTRGGTRLVRLVRGRGGGDLPLPAVTLQTPPLSLHQRDLEAEVCDARRALEARLPAALRELAKLLPPGSRAVPLEPTVRAPSDLDWLSFRGESAAAVQAALADGAAE